MSIYVYLWVYRKPTSTFSSWVPMGKNRGNVVEFLDVTSSR